MRARDRERGSVLLVTLMLIVLMCALGGALVLTTSVETMIAGNFNTAEEARHAADAAADRTVGELGAIASWDQVLNGTIRSSFVDGAPNGTRTLRDGSTIDLTQLANLANCHKSTTCSSADMNAVTADRPWGPNNPRWQLFAYGPLADALPGGKIDSPFYTVVLVADDSSETDNDPTHDAVAPASGAGIVVVRAMAFGPRKARRVIELTVVREAAGLPTSRRSWRELRTSP